MSDLAVAKGVAMGIISSNACSSDHQATVTDAQTYGGRGFESHQSNSLCSTGLYHDRCMDMAE